MGRNYTIAKKTCHPFSQIVSHTKIYRLPQIHPKLTQKFDSFWVNFFEQHFWRFLAWNVKLCKRFW